MQERELRDLIEDVREGKLPRRGFIHTCLLFFSWLASAKKTRNRIVRIYSDGSQK